MSRSGRRHSGSWLRIAFDLRGESRRRCRSLQAAGLQVARDPGGRLAQVSALSEDSRRSSVSALAGDFSDPSTPFLPGDLRRVPGGGVRAGKYRQCFMCDHRAISFLRLAGGGWLPRHVQPQARYLQWKAGRPPRGAGESRSAPGDGRPPSVYTTPPFLPFGATGGRDFFATYLEDR